ncbi:unnamed protein product [Gongylonema pulchrum]|uniref:TPR_REGION domain-containing protein n=1 Tax=Gongylonema pulchrum TaxID=637853 RepID=A0A183DJE9_9BILA|nr:unnamed protein product [Gongylonema pulchrum]
MARALELQEQWDEALAKYTLAIEGAMRVLSSEDRSAQRAVKLQRKISNWLSSAERIKKYVEVMEAVYGISLNGDDEAEKQLQITANKHCSLM